MAGILKCSILDAMKKDSRIESFVESLGAGEAGGLSRFYLAYFDCFNRQLYYEAHDVLEHLWLKERGREGGHDTFFKGLIQLSGAFVHLQKQFLRPGHPKDGRRLAPALRLLGLARENIAPYRPVCLSLDVDAVHRLCEAWEEALLASHCTRNPWRPDAAPTLSLLHR